MLVCDKRRMQKVYHRGMSGRAPIFLPGKEDKSSSQSEPPPSNTLKHSSSSHCESAHYWWDSSLEEGLILPQNPEPSHEEIGLCAELQQHKPIDPHYPTETRPLKLSRYRAKKLIRKWDHIISYPCRKRVADNRARINGRFVKHEQEPSCKEIEELLCFS